MIIIAAFIIYISFCNLQFNIYKTSDNIGAYDSFSHVLLKFQIKKKQRELLQTLESLKIEFETVDISDPSKEEEKKFMRANSKPAQEGKVPLPPQVFKDDDYCGVSLFDQLYCQSK